MRTSPSCPQPRPTSRMGDEMVRLPAARYSGVLVGLMKRVDSLSAKKSAATSHPAM
jgi:hypothetical protein